MNHDDHKNPGKIFGSLKPTCKGGTLELTVHQITVSGASKNLTWVGVVFLAEFWRYSHDDDLLDQGKHVYEKKMGFIFFWNGVEVI